MQAGARVLYVSYDGMTDPLGRSQVLPYLSGLAGRGHQLTVLSCEKPEVREAEKRRVSDLCAEAGIEWHPLTYRKRPPVLSTMLDLASMKRAAASLHRQRKFDLIHCRSYIPALVGDWMKRRFGVRFLFDMRGFWADEKAEGGDWPQGNPLFKAVYRHFKARESEFLRNADAIVSLTSCARDEMAGWRDAPNTSVSVIPCCVDFGHFRMPSAEQRGAARAALGIAPDRPVLAYVGSLGGNYMLDEMLRFLLAFRELRPDALFLVVTRSQPDEIIHAAARLGIAPDELLIRAADRDEVPTFLSAADAGVAFKQPSFSAKACSPTKLGEMLALGIPVVANSGVGDVEAMIADTEAGVIVDRFDEAALNGAAAKLLELKARPEQVREAARRWFELERGIAEYDAIYRAIAPARSA